MASPRRPYGTGSFVERGGVTHFRWRPVRGENQRSRRICAIGELTKTMMEKKARRIESDYESERSGRARGAERAPTVNLVAGCLDNPSLQGGPDEQRG
jgi:hypothetical protein